VFFQRRKLKQISVIPLLFPLPYPIEQSAAFLARYFVSNNPARQGIKLRSANGAQRLNPMAPTFRDRVIRAVENCAFKIRR
jgi:hypothetical protein